jgi:type I restriction-modification system DNA methylase subunit
MDKSASRRTFRGMFTKEQALSEIQQLVTKYQSYGEKVNGLDEEETKKDFILPLFRALNWKVEDSREVSAEEKISKKRVDYGFRIEGIPKFFLEAKAIKESLSEEFARQSVNYSWLKSTTWAVLTNFARIDVYNAEWKSRSVLEKRFFSLKVDEFVPRFDRLWLLSRDAFEVNELDRTAEDWGKKLPKVPVTQQLFADLIDWRQRLTKAINDKRTNASVIKNEKDLDESVQRILDRMIFIRVCEDRQIEPFTLLSRLREWKGAGRTRSFYKLLVDVFSEFNANYDSKLFDHHTSDELEIDDFVLSSMINELYENKEHSVYDFSAIDADILGSIYEQYLGFILQKHKRKATVIESYAQRKKMGIYYTPTQITNLMVKSTIGEILNGSEEHASLRVLDPACGSGSFLLSALDLLLAREGLTSFDEKIALLKRSIYGVDLDPKAVEIAQFNLLLRILERRKILPVMDDNVRLGNSLIEERKVDPNPLIWKEVFRNVLAEGGFDVVVGNPPYVNAIELSKTVGEKVKDYWKDTFVTAKGTYDIYILFFERALQLCREGGYVSFITPNKYLSSPYGVALREHILKNHTLVKVIDLSRIKVFDDPSVYPIITIIKKGKAAGNYTILTERILSEDLSKKVQFRVSSKTLEMMPENNWGIILSDHAKLIQKVFEQGEPLEQVASVQATSTAAEADEYSGYISDRKGVKIINSGTIDRFSTSYGINAFTNKGEKLLKPLLDISRISDVRRKLYESPKLIFAKLALRPEAYIDLKGEYASINTNCVHSPNEGYDLRVLGAILNSTLMAFVYSEMFSGLKMGGGYFQFQAPQLRILPIKKPTPDQAERLAGLTDQYIDLDRRFLEAASSSDEAKRLEGEIQRVDMAIDEVVYELYGLDKDEVEKIERSVLHGGKG